MNSVKIETYKNNRICNKLMEKISWANYEVKDLKIRGIDSKVFEVSADSNNEINLYIGNLVLNIENLFKVLFPDNYLLEVTDGFIKLGFIASFKIHHPYDPSKIILFSHRIKEVKK